MYTLFTLNLFLLSLAFVGKIYAECPGVEVVAPCTCVSDKTGESELSCIESFMNQEDLDSYFETLSSKLPTDQLSFTKLLTSNNKFTALNANTFGKVTFQSLNLYETNLTSIDKAFTVMAENLKSLFITSNSLTNWVFLAIEEVPHLETLTLKLGLRSFASFTEGSVTDVSINLTTIDITNVATVIESNAFGKLPSINAIRIHGELNAIRQNAFDFRNVTKPSVTLDLSNNKLDEQSLHEGFIQADTSTQVILNLEGNQFKTIPTELKSFFLANSDNVIHLGENPIDCSICDSYWVITTVTKWEQFFASCLQGKNIFYHDWQHCRNSVPTISLSSFTLLCLLLSLFTSVW